MGNRQSSVTSTVENVVKNDFEQSCNISQVSNQSIDGLVIDCGKLDGITIENTSKVQVM